MSKSNAIAVFDISSSSVGGAHALVERDGDKNSVTILVQDRRDSGLEEEINIERFVEDTAKTLEVVISHVRTADVHHPKVIQVLLGSPWYTAYTRTITYTKNTIFTCTERLVESLIEKELAFLLKQDDGTGTPLGTNFVMAEQQISHVLLNGYETADFYGKKAQSMEIVLHVSLMPRVVAERFTSMLRRSYGNRKILVTTSPYAAFVALRDNGGIEPKSAIIDVGEEVTDVALIKNGVLLSQQSFPVGTYELYRALHHATGTTAEAKALVEAYRLKKLSPGSSRSVEKALHVFAQRWQEGLHSVIDTAMNGLSFPQTCYVIADYRFESFFNTIIGGDQYLLHAAAAQTLRVRMVDPSQFSTAIKVVSTEQPDATLAIGALFTERLL